jgi:hypothetical protein
VQHGLQVLLRHLCTRCFRHAGVLAAWCDISARVGLRGLGAFIWGESPKSTRILGTLEPNTGENLQV